MNLLLDHGDFPSIVEEKSEKVLPPTLVFDDSNSDGFLDRAPVAQLIEHRVVMREVVSSTPAGPTLRVLK